MVGSIFLLSAEKAYQKINCLWPNSSIIYLPSGHGTLSLHEDHDLDITLYLTDATSWPSAIGDIKKTAQEISWLYI